jgi:thioredoxin-like negative regulator of GroEL
LLRAFELQPQSNPIRLTLAGSLIGEGRYSEARTVLKPAAFSVHDPGAAGWAQKMLGQIDHLADGAPPPAMLPAIDKLDGAEKKG